jgi:hypothetical protein
MATLSITSGTCRANYHMKICKIKYLLYFCWTRLVSHDKVVRVATNTGSHATTKFFYERTSLFSINCLQHSCHNKHQPWQAAWFPLWKQTWQRKQSLLSFWTLPIAFSYFKHNRAFLSSGRKYSYLAEPVIKSQTWLLDNEEMSKQSTHFHSKGSW